MKKSTGSIDKEIGGRVRMRRVSIGMSQEKLGDMLGLTFQQVQKYEKGMNRISVARLVEIARILGVDIDFFFDGIKPGKGEAGFADSGAPGYVADMMSTPEGLQLVRHLYRHQKSQGPQEHRAAGRLSGCPGRGRAFVIKNAFA